MLKCTHFLLLLSPRVNNSTSHLFSVTEKVFYFPIAITEHPIRIE